MQMVCGMMWCLLQRKNSQKKKTNPLFPETLIVCKALFFYLIAAHDDNPEALSLSQLRLGRG